MTTAKFIRSLSHLSKTEALGQIEGFISARERWGPPISPEERQALALAKVEIQAGRRA